MERASAESSLVDLLDRTLDKGIVIGNLFGGSACSSRAARFTVTRFELKLEHSARLEQVGSVDGPCDDFA